jgi:hypothetical protein
MARVLRVPAARLPVVVVVADVAVVVVQAAPADLYVTTLRNKRSTLTAKKHILLTSFSGWRK